MNKNSHQNSLFDKDFDKDFDKLQKMQSVVASKSVKRHQFLLMGMTSG